MRELVLSMLLVVSAGLATAQVNPRAQTLLDRAEASWKADDFAAALQAYVDAVALEPGAASLERIRRYAPPVHAAPHEKAAAIHLQALRQYVRLRSEDWEGVVALTEFAELSEGEELLEPWIAKRNDAEVFAARARLRARHGGHASALADFERAVLLDSANPERHYVVGVVAWESASRQPGLTPEQRRDLIRRGLAALQRAEELRPDYTEAIVYRSLLLRDEAKVEPDPKRQERLIEEADTHRARAVEIMKRRREASAAPPPQPQFDDDTNWVVAFFQDGTLHWPDERGEVRLQRKPFTIRVAQNSLTPLMLNVLDRDEVIRRIRPGFRLAQECEQPVPFCPGTGMAEELFNPARRLITSSDGMHYLYFDSPEDHRWSRFTLGETNHFERDVALIDDTPIEKTKIPAVYLLFGMHRNGDGVLSEEELQPVIVRFR